MGRAGFKLAVLGALLAGVTLGFTSSQVMEMVADGQIYLNFTFLGLGPGKRMRQLFVNGRSVWVYQPLQSWAAQQSGLYKPLPAIFVLHGTGDSPLGIAGETLFPEFAEVASPGFLLVFPEMARPGNDDWGYWDPSEMAFFRAAAERVTEEYPIDRQQIFITGHSCGGSMSLFLQNNMADVFKAAAAVEAGVAYGNHWDLASVGRPVMLVWNHKDNVLKEWGGDALFRRTLRILRRHDPAGAEAAPAKVEQLAVGAGLPGGTVLYAERMHWPAAGQAPPLTVVSWETARPTHDWPNPKQLAGSFDVAPLIWSFFQSTADWTVEETAPPDLAAENATSHW